MWWQVFLNAQHSYAVKKSHSGAFLIASEVLFDVKVVTHCCGLLAFESAIYFSISVIKCFYNVVLITSAESKVEGRTISYE